MCAGRSLPPTPTSTTTWRTTTCWWRPEMASRQFATFEVADQLFGVEVDTVQEVLSYNLDDDTFEPPPDTLSGPTRELVVGTFKLDGRLMLALDVNQAVDTYRATT